MKMILDKEKTILKNLLRREHERLRKKLSYESNITSQMQQEIVVLQVLYKKVDGF